MDRLKSKANRPKVLRGLISTIGFIRWIPTESRYRKASIAIGPETARIEARSLAATEAVRSRGKDPDRPPKAGYGGRECRSTLAWPENMAAQRHRPFGRVTAAKKNSGRLSLPELEGVQIDPPASSPAGLEPHPGAANHEEHPDEGHEGKLAGLGNRDETR